VANHISHNKSRGVTLYLIKLIFISILYIPSRVLNTTYNIDLSKVTGSKPMHGLEIMKYTLENIFKMVANFMSRIHCP
jgi:hypothetical protein